MVRIGFQADANLDPAIGIGLRRREPTLAYRLAAGVIPDGLPDPAVLALAARSGRVLVTSDFRTMPKHFEDFIRSEESPGLILVPRTFSIGEAIEALLVAWLSWDADQIRNQIRWLPPGG